MNNAMKIKRILGPLLLVVIAILIFILAVGNSKRPYSHSSTRVLIPDTNVSVQIPAEFLYNPSGLYIFEDPYKTFATPIPLLKLLAFEALIPDPYRGYQSPEQVTDNFFKGNVPEKQIIHEFEVYLLRQDWPIRTETVILKGLILYGEEQYISLDFHGPSSESRRLYALVDAVLNSMWVEGK
jgi:hypothetical protein